MNEKKTGKALVHLENSSPKSTRDPGEIAQQIIKRDRLRIQLLAGVSALLWILTVAGVIWLIVFYFMYVVPRLDAYAAGRLQLDNDWHEWIRAFNAGAQIILTCIVAFLMAALGTVLLVFASRSATLRQINADLAEISEQLRQLRLGEQKQSSES
jgi:hypothetical protein